MTHDNPYDQREADWRDEDLRQRRAEEADEAFNERRQLDDFDYEAVAWAYSKCVALGLENGSMESAMMMDRLKLMLS